MTVGLDDELPQRLKLTNYCALFPCQCEHLGRSIFNDLAGWLGVGKNGRKRPNCWQVLLTEETDIRPCEP